MVQEQVPALTLCFSQETVDKLGLTAVQRGDVNQIVDAIQECIEGQI
jgi:hypothetical protein